MSSFDKVHSQLQFNIPQEYNHGKRVSGKKLLVGDIREEYRTHHFQISVAGTDWIFPELLGTTTTRAVLSMKECNSENFVEILRTEPLKVRSPKFTRRASFNPLTMENSQHYALNSILRLKVIINEKEHWSFDFSLSKLLWDQFLEAKLNPFVPKLSEAKYTGSRGIVRINVIRCREIGEPYDTHKIIFSICIPPALVLRIQESRVYFAFSSVAEKGRWSRLFTSDVLRLPSLPRTFQFPSAVLTKGDLISFCNTNPIRLWLYSLRCGAEKPLGYCQFNIIDLRARESLTWNSKYLTAHVLLSDWVSTACGTKSSICFTLHTVSEARKLLSDKTVTVGVATATEDVAGLAADLDKDASNSCLSSSSTPSQQESVKDGTNFSRILPEQVRFPPD